MKAPLVFPSPTAVPLTGAALCLDCETISTCSSDWCAHCGGRGRMMLAQILNRPDLAGVAALYEDAGTPATICTYTGRSVRPLNARVGDICIEDIAHALSLQCRFGGHTKRFYSVAEHSIYVAGMVPKEQRLAALLHDAAEAYLVDLPRPLKVLPEFAAYRQAEEHLMAVIGKCFGFDPALTFEIHDADQAMCAQEMRELMRSGPYLVTGDEGYAGRFENRLGDVESAFLKLFRELTRGR